MIRKLYDRVIGLAAHPQAIWWLALVSFAESSVFPIPPDAMIVPMVLSDRAAALRIALVSTTSSVLGGLAGYAIGYFFFDAIGGQIIDFYGYGAKFEEFRGTYTEYGAWIVALAGLTPLPYKVITIASGVFALDLFVFTVASVLSRGARFGFEAALLWKFGEPIREFIERRLEILSLVFVLLFVGGFALIKLL
ncbi:MAG: cytochrome B [Rickettsiales bacterium]|jgi:membrane protein YqaA with SNARE-associated domain|nr:cytochrome B [Rickettsiales bacterium]